MMRPNNVEKQVRPTETVLFDFGDWTNSQWTEHSSGSQGTITKYTDRITFYNGSGGSGNYLSQYQIDCTKDFLLEFRANIPNTSLSYHSVGLSDMNGDSVDFGTNWESTYRNKIWCQINGGRYAGETNPGTADYFIRKTGNTVEMGRGGVIKYTATHTFNNIPYYLSEGVYRETLTIYTAKLTYL